MTDCVGFIRVMNGVQCYVFDVVLFDRLPSVNTHMYTNCLVYVHNWPNTPLIVGLTLGIGIPLLVVLIAIVIIIVRRRRRRVQKTNKALVRLPDPENLSHSSIFPNPTFDDKMLESFDHDPKSSIRIPENLDKPILKHGGGHRRSLLPGVRMSFGGQYFNRIPTVQKQTFKPCEEEWVGLDPAPSPVRDVGTDDEIYTKTLVSDTRDPGVCKPRQASMFPGSELRFNDAFPVILKSHDSIFPHKSMMDTEEDHDDEIYSKTVVAGVRDPGLSQPRQASMYPASEPLSTDALSVILKSHDSIFPQKSMTDAQEDDDDHIYSKTVVEGKRDPGLSQPRQASIYPASEPLSTDEHSVILKSHDSIFPQKFNAVEK